LVVVVLNLVSVRWWWLSGVWWVFFDTDSLTFFQICWDLQNSFWVAEGFQICWDLQVSVSGWPMSRRCWLFGGGLRAEMQLPRSSFYRCPINFYLMELSFRFLWAGHFWFEIGS
jgi:hypothetical protein